MKAKLTSVIAFATDKVIHGFNHFSNIVIATIVVVVVNRNLFLEGCLTSSNSISNSIHDSASLRLLLLLQQGAVTAVVKRNERSSL